MEEIAVAPVEATHESANPELSNPELGHPELGHPEIEQPFVGRWHRLISTTNWEKGCIIQQWREALVAAGGSASEYSDEAWSQRVGGVTGQHVGRLRRVYQRFGGTQAKYSGLYWSHFQAALEWEDAEMWLEGAVQSGWSVSAMRRMRWQTLGAIAESEPRDDEVVSSELDEDYRPTAELRLDQAQYADRMEGPPVPEGPDFGDEDYPTERPGEEAGSAQYPGPEEQVPVPVTTPFKDLAELPPDVTEAFDAMKLAILRHKRDGWRQVACDDLLAALDALKELALAPSADLNQ